MLAVFIVPVGQFDKFLHEKYGSHLQAQLGAQKLIGFPNYEIYLFKLEL